MTYRRQAIQNIFRVLGQRYVLALLLFIVVAALLVAFYLSRSPSGFQSGAEVHIPEGTTLSQVVVLLDEAGVLRSPRFFHLHMRLAGLDRTIHAGDYIFEEPISMFGVAKRLSRGDFGLGTVKVTLAEGLTISEIADIMVGKFYNIDKESFTEAAQSLEGYLFPDTYHFLENVGPKQAVREMLDNLESNIQGLGTTTTYRVMGGEYNLHEILTMASLIEEEARQSETRRKVSGILWNRINANHPLQVDAVFPYIIGKNTFEVTLDDLNVDNPYNTYRHVGFPPGPISNPGLDSIQAALNPIETDNFFYLTGHDGVMYYAKTFTDHKVNKFKHLGK